MSLYDPLLSERSIEQIPTEGTASRRTYAIPRSIEQKTLLRRARERGSALRIGFASLVTVVAIATLGYQHLSERAKTKERAERFEARTLGIIASATAVQLDTDIALTGRQIYEAPTLLAESRTGTLGEILRDPIVTEEGFLLGYCETPVGRPSLREIEPAQACWVALTDEDPSTYTGFYVEPESAFTGRIVSHEG